jgi:uncharacterized membrane protein
MRFEPAKKKVIIILAILTITGAFLRFYKLDFQSLWFDELHSIVPTSPERSISSIIEYCKTDQPPAFFLYLHFFFKFFGYSSLAGRCAAALLGVAAIPAMYLLGKECRNVMTGLVAATFTAVNYFAILYSQEMRFYSMAFLFSALSFLFLLRSWKYVRPIDFILYSLTTTVLLYTHYFGLIILASQVFIFFLLILFFRPPLQSIIMAGVSGIFVCFLFIPWVPVIVNDLQIPWFWIQKPKANFFLEYYYGYFGKDIIVSLCFGALLIFFFRNLRWKIDSSQSKAIYIVLISWVILSYSIPYVRSLISVSILHMRYTIVTVPALIIIFSIGWDSFTNVKVKYTLIALIILSSVLNLFLVRGFYSKITKQQFRESASFLKDKNSMALPVHSNVSWHYSFYLNRPEERGQHFIDRQAVDSVDAFWFLPIALFSNSDIDTEISQFTDFRAAERADFHKTSVVLMIRKEN